MPKILGKAGTTIADTKIDEVIADSRVRADTHADLLNVCIHPLGQFTRSFIKLIFVVSIAYLVNSAERISMTNEL